MFETNRFSEIEIDGIETIRLFGLESETKDEIEDFILAMQENRFNNKEVK